MYLPSDQYQALTPDQQQQWRDLLLQVQGEQALTSSSAQRNEGSGSGRANAASSYVDRPPINDRFTSSSNSVRGGAPTRNQAKRSSYRGPRRQGPSLAERQIRGWQRQPDFFKISTREAGMMLCTFLLGLAIPTTSLILVLLSVMVGMMWSQRKSFDLWCWRRSLDQEVHRYSDMYGVTSAPYAELSVTEPQAAVNSASTEHTVE